MKGVDSSKVSSVECFGGGQNRRLTSFTKWRAHLHIMHVHIHT